MAGIEPQSSGVGSDHSANCATTTAQLKKNTSSRLRQIFTTIFYKVKIRQALPRPLIQFVRVTRFEPLPILNLERIITYFLEGGSITVRRPPILYAAALYLILIISTDLLVWLNIKQEVGHTLIFPLEYSLLLPRKNNPS